MNGEPKISGKELKANDFLTCLGYFPTFINPSNSRRFPCLVHHLPVQQAEKCPAVAISEKEEFLPVAPRSYMIKRTSKSQAKRASHGKRVTPSRLEIKGPAPNFPASSKARKNIFPYLPRFQCRFCQEGEQLRANRNDSNDREY